MTNIIVRNKFTNLNNQSNGNTPSDFVKAYTLRKSATELVYPVSTDDSEFPVMSTTSKQSQVHAFNLNKKTVEVDYLSKDESAELYSDSLQMEGRCFDLNRISLGKRAIENTTQSIQKAFNEAHTVMLMVVSFDTNYLRQRGVLRTDSPVKKDYNPKGLMASETDELKLRLAIKYGLSKLTESLGYTKPIAIGSIQLDTDNPHAHIVLTETDSRENSNAKLFYDGLEWGKLNPVQIKAFENAIDFDLTQQQDLAVYPSNTIKNILNRNQEKIASFSNLKLYAQVAALSILPENTNVSDYLKDQISNEVGLSRKHISNVTVEAKRAKDKNPTKISPYLKIQVTPLANQFDLSENLQKFSKKKKVRRANASLIKTEIIEQFQQTVHVLRNDDYTDDQKLLSKMKLVKTLYDKAENDLYVYQSAVTQDELEIYQSDIETLTESVQKQPVNRNLTLAQEQLLEVSVNAVLDKVLTAKDVDILLASDFSIETKPERFKFLTQSEDFDTTRNNLIRRITELERTTNLPEVKAFQTETHKTSQLVIPKVTSETTIDEVLATLDLSDGVYDLLRTSADDVEVDLDIEIDDNLDNFRKAKTAYNKTKQPTSSEPENKPPRPTLTDLEKLFVFEDPIEKALLDNATLHTDDALNIISRNVKLEKAYGPDF